MKKLRLDIEELQLVQFEVESEIRDANGTVIAASGTLTATTWPIRYCPNMPNTTEAC